MAIAPRGANGAFEEPSLWLRCHISVLPVCMFGECSNEALIKLPNLLIAAAPIDNFVVVQICLV